VVIKGGKVGGEDLSKLKIDKAESVVRPKKKRKLFRLYAGILLVLIVAVLYSRGVFTPAVEVEAANVSLVYPSQSFTVLNASGYVVAQRKASVASKVTGRLISLSVEEGSRVKKGEIIARLENEDVLAVRNQAEANLNSSRHTLEQAEAELKDAGLAFERAKDLLSKGYIARSDYDSADARFAKAEAAVAADKAMVKAAQAALQSANVGIDYTLLRAPFDAVVLTKNADIGDIVTPIGAAANVQAAVVTIADMDSLQVEADVSESNLSQIKVGQPCEIQLDSIPDTRFPGKVHMIVPTADRTKATVMVKVRFLEKDSRILPEMSARVAFLERPVSPGEERPRTAVNSKAIITGGGKKVVFLIRKERVVETPVTTGQQLGDMTETLSGVKAGDRVVLKPLEKLKNGSRIKVAEGT
jgi:RND family efflux transporter MFP subunit